VAFNHSADPSPRAQEWKPDLNELTKGEVSGWKLPRWWEAAATEGVESKPPKSKEARKARTAPTEAPGGAGGAADGAEGAAGGGAAGGAEGAADGAAGGAEGAADTSL